MMYYQHLKSRMLVCASLLVLASIFLVTGTGKVSAATSPQKCTWNVVTSPDGGSSSNFLYGIAATSTKNVWAVGFYYSMPGNVPAQTLTERWNGSSWSVITSPNVGTNNSFLYGVAATSGKNAWAVGSAIVNGSSQTLIEQWNGTSWSIVASPNVASASNSLYGVTADAANDAWAVGYSVGSSTVQTLIEHWNGTSWSIVTSPNNGAGDSLSGVSAHSSSDAWAVGAYSSNGLEQTLTEHWNGTQWSIVASPDVSGAGNSLASVVDISSQDAWTVGFANGSIKQTLVEQWNGKKWHIVTSANVSGDDNDLTGITAISANSIWAVGYATPHGGGFDQTLTEHWNSSSWKIVASPNVGPGNSDLYGVANAPGSKQVWATGVDNNSSGVPQTLSESHC
ncbi:MAG: hypothetical protein ACYDER_27845 [Ktedonobacteraceae bacterium]